MRTLATIAALALCLAACGSGLPDPEYSAEVPAGSGTWTPASGDPEWVAAPPRRPGALVFVATGRSNLRAIAAAGPRPSADREAAKRVADALAPVVGADDAAKAAAALPKSLRLVARACREELLTRELVPGNTLCTAWALWEAPIDEIAAAVPDAERDAVRRALDDLAAELARPRESAPPR